MKRFLAIVSVLLCLTLLGTSTVFADAEPTSDYGLTEFGADLDKFFGEDGKSIELAPGKVYSCDIPLSNGDVAKLECAVESYGIRPFADYYEYETGVGSSWLSAKITYDLIGSYSQKIDLNVTQTSPCCHFKVTGNSVYNETPAPVTTFVTSSAQQPVNYSSGTSSKADAYASFKTADVVPVNIYSRILANSLKAGIMTYTVYYSLTPISG